mgnify:CR=1 FL=1
MDRTIRWFTWFHDLTRKLRSASVVTAKENGARMLRDHEFALDHATVTVFRKRNDGILRD